jgi:hypothetical protein
MGLPFWQRWGTQHGGKKMPVTYFCTDADGNTYNRFSKDHEVPRYVSAAINRPKGEAASKGGVGYTSGRLPKHGPADFIYYSNGGGVWTCEQVPVRAYLGRHKAEPGV